MRLNRFYTSLRNGSIGNTSPLGWRLRKRPKGLILADLEVRRVRFSTVLGTLFSSSLYFWKNCASGRGYARTSHPPTCPPKRVQVPSQASRGVGRSIPSRRGWRATEYQGGLAVSMDGRSSCQPAGASLTRGASDVKVRLRSWCIRHFSSSQSLISLFIGWPPVLFPTKTRLYQPESYLRCFASFPNPPLFLNVEPLHGLSYHVFSSSSTTTIRWHNDSSLDQ